jgi:hypothetical protein
MLNRWPDLAQSKRDVVKIFVGLKLYGYRVEDLDLVVIGSFAAPRPFDVEFAFHPRDEEPFVPKGASVKNFALVIEVKSHDATGVRFENRVASVRYVRNGRSTWECVTEKNRTQMFEFKKYLSRHGIERLHVQDLILFTGVRESDLPKRPHNCIAGDASFERVLNVLGQISRPVRKGSRVDLAFGPDDVFDRLLSPNFPLFEELEPTPLDRRRMDMIAKRSLPEAWLDDLGERQVTLKGRGGVGKTVILLQMAFRAYETRQLRSLVLTFNKALVADLRRTMALLGVPRSLDGGGIGVETVHSFMGRLMIGLGVIKSYEGFLEGYDGHKATLLKYLESGAVSRDDLDALLQRQPTDLEWDLVFIDEGQDWPCDEIAILRAVYGPDRLTISDGVDQFVRESVADWSIGVPKSSLKARRLTRCMRMKANLAAFVSDMAECLGLENWDIEPNTEASGGRVIIVEGDLASSPSLIAQFCAEARELGNRPVDLLACVPPAMVDPATPDQLCRPAAHYVRAGGAVWDGTSRDVREHFPTHRDQLRFVQYDSCRGLEAWTTINYAIDELWEYKRQQWLAEERASDDLFHAPADQAQLHASRWLMIPLTRSIDTLVINIGLQDSFVKHALLTVAARRADFVQWVTDADLDEISKQV